MSRSNPHWGSRQVHQHGRIVGGRLDGWSYAFLRLGMQTVQTTLGPMPAPDMDVIVRATPPNWPFPMEVALPGGSYHALESLPGVRTRRLDVEVMEGDAITEWNLQHGASA